MIDARSEVRRQRQEENITTMGSGQRTKSKLFVTVFAGLFSLGLLACKNKPEEPKPGEPAPTEPAKTEPAKTEPVKTEPAKTEPAGGGGGDKIGVASCDEWIEKYIKCIESRVPEAARQQMKDALKLTAETYKRTASTGEGKNKLENACKQMIESTKQATASFGCEW